MLATPLAAPDIAGAACDASFAVAPAPTIAPATSCDAFSIDPCGSGKADLGQQPAHGVA
jgi:hypothetical protein